MPKAKTETRPHSEHSRGLSHTNPWNSVQASSTASHSLASNMGASERVRCSSLTLFSSHPTSLIVTRDAIRECAAPSLFGDTSRKGCRRGFSSFLNSSSCPAHYSCILSVDRGGCLHAHLQAPRCPPLPHLPPMDQTPPVPPLHLRAWLHPWFSSVANAANSLTGVAVQAPLEMPGQLFQSAGLPVDACVSEKLRAKIWSNEYIDFGSLLTNPVFKNQYRLTFQGTDSGPVTSLCLETVSKPKKIQSV